MSVTLGGSEPQARYHRPITPFEIDPWIREPLWSQEIEDLDAALQPDLANVAELASRIPLRIFGEILLDPVKWLPRGGSYLPVMPGADVQVSWNGEAGADLLARSVDFIRCLINAAATRGIPISECQSLDFGIGWGRLARLWLRYAPPTNLAGCDSWNKSLSVAKNCNLQNELRQSDPLLTTLPFDPGRFDIVWAYSVFTHLSPDAFQAVLLGISEMLTKDGVFVFTVRPHSVWEGQLRARAASAEASLRQETADGARFVQQHPANPHFGDLSVSVPFLQERCRQAGLRIDSFDWSAREPYQIVVAASHILGRRAAAAGLRTASLDEVLGQGSSTSAATTPVEGSSPNACAPRLILAGHSHLWAIAGQSIHSESLELVAGSRGDGTLIMVGPGPGRDMSYFDTLAELAVGADVGIVWNGNEHNALYLLEAETPFDFLSPHVRKMNPSAQMKSKTAIRDSLQQFSFHNLDVVLKRLATGGPNRIALIGTPPPKGDNEALRDLLQTEPLFVNRAAQLGQSLETVPITDPYVRLKLWYLLQELQAEVARTRGLMFIPVPKEVQDADGFLKREFWASDVTHANAAYGNVMYEAVIQAFR